MHCQLLKISCGMDASRIAYVSCLLVYCMIPISISYDSPCFASHLLINASEKLMERTFPGMWQEVLDL